jgi:hypothetical protein
MSVSNHPIALRFEQRVGGATKLLATVMGLPLIDGIFPALVIAEALTYPWGILQTGLLIFGGSATVAVILAEMEGSRREKATAVLLLGVVLVPLAVVEAAFAETLRSVLSFEVFHRFAGLVILAIAAKTASAAVGKYLPSPGAIIGLGLVASFQPADAQLVISFDPATLAAAGAAAGTGVAFALSVAIAAPRLRGAVDIDRFRFGSAVALGMLALEVLGLLPTEQPVALGVLAVTALFAYDPEAAASGSVGDDGPTSGPADLSGDSSSAAGPTASAATNGGSDTGSLASDSHDGNSRSPTRASSADGGPTAATANGEDSSGDGEEQTSGTSPAQGDDENTPERPPYL